MKRNYNLDKYRGFTIISMVLFHLMYNINYYWHIPWYAESIFNKIWQISIAGSFFIISGITSNFLSPKENIKRGIITSLIGFAITIITYIFSKDQFILWGVLNGLGASMLIGGLIQKKNHIHLRLIPIFLILFTVTYKIPRGVLYDNGILTKIYDANLFIFGFPSDKFYSNDYFPLIPWLFLYLFGLYLGKFLKNKNFYGYYGADSWLAKIGRYSMPIYLAHQVLLYPLVTIIYKLTQ